MLGIVFVSILSLLATLNLNLTIAFKVKPLLISSSRLFATGQKKWTVDSWKKLPIKQPPNYPDDELTEEVVQKLSKCSPLVFAGEVRTLQEDLAKASAGQGFVLMGGDCAEAFNEFSVDHIRDTLRVILQMSLI